MIDIEEFIVLEKEITSTEDTILDSQRESIRKRWEFGRALLARRVGKQLPNGLLDQLSTEIGCGRTELKYRMLAAAKYPTEDEVVTAMTTCPSWTQFKKTLAKPKPEGPQKKEKPIPASPISRDPKHEEIVSRSKSGESRSSIAKGLGVTDRTVRRELEVEATIEAAAPVDWETIPDSAKVKINREVERQYKKLAAQLKSQQEAEIQKRVELLVKMQREALAVKEIRVNHILEAQRAKGVLALSDYKLIKACLHPDSRDSVSHERLAAAFRIFNDPKIEMLLVKGQ